MKTGEKILIKGHTGAGKTTLLKAVGGLGKMDYKVIIDGAELRLTQVWQPIVALVSQNPFLYGDSLTEMVTGKKELNKHESDLYKESIEISGLVEWNLERGCFY